MHRVFATVAFPFAALFVSLVPRFAAAQECDADNPCDKGFVCQETAGVCPAIACAPNADCPPCDPKTYKSCVLAPCDPNGPADQCGDDKVCYTSNVDNCTSPACPPGKPCPDLVVCTPQSQSTCTYKASLPCQTATDCGDGYECKTQQTCSCSGSAGSAGSGGGMAPAADAGVAMSTPVEPPPIAPTPAADGGTPPPDMLPPDCSCMDTDQKWCQPKEMTCNTLNDCPKHWTCEPVVMTGGTCTASADGGKDCSPPPPSSGVSECFPPSYSGGSLGIDEGTPTSAPSVPGSGDTASGGTTSSGNEGAGAPPPSVGNPSNDSTSNGDVMTTAASTKHATSGGNGGGCSLAGAGTSGVSTAWLALALVALARRRRT